MEPHFSVTNIVMCPHFNINNNNVPTHIQCELTHLLIKPMYSVDTYNTDTGLHVGGYADFLKDR